MNMGNEKIIRMHLLSLLKGGNAHITFDEAAKNFPMANINDALSKVPYTPWHLLEHMRRTQSDILDFIRNPDYKYLKWPDDYWPSKSNNATRNDWENSISMFNNDAKELQKIASNPKTDLYSKIPHGEGQTVLREMLLVADHNAYHLGEFVLMQRAMGLWKKE